MADQTTTVAGITQTVPNSSLAITAIVKEWAFAQTPPNPNSTPPVSMVLWSPDANWLYSTDNVNFIPVVVAEKWVALIPYGGSIFAKTASGAGTLYAVRVG